MKRKRLSFTIATAVVMMFLSHLAYGQIPLPVQPVLIFPQIAFGGGWFTSILVTNVTDSHQGFVHYFTAPDGGSLRVPVTIGNDGQRMEGLDGFANSIPAKSSFLITLRSSDPKVTTGWMNTLVNVVDGKDAMKVQVTYYYAPNGEIQGQASVTPSAVHPSKSSRSFSFQTYSASQFSDTGVAIVNWSNLTASVRMTVYSMTGAVASTADFSMPKGGQIAKMLTELAPDLRNSGWSGGLVEFSSDQNISGMSLSMNGRVFSTGSTFQ